MPATLAQLASRALRKLGVAIVANAAAPALGATVTSAEVAIRALRELGIPVPDTARPPLTATISQAEIATRALRSVGVDQAGAAGAAIDTATLSNAAAIAPLVLLNLGVIAPDDDLTLGERAADLAAAVEKVNAVHQHLAALDVVTWTIDAVPQHAVEWYVMMAANLAAAEFGKAGNPEAFGLAEQTLRRQALAGPSGQAMAEAKVAAVHDAVVATGVAGWLLTSIPQAYAEDYATMAAALLAPVMGFQQDAPSRQVTAAAWAAALDRIRKGQAVAGAQARALERVQEVHDELNAGNLVTWTIGAIPLAAVDAYVGMAATLMGPDFGKEVDPKLYALHMTRVRRIAMGGAAGQALAQQKVVAVHASLAAARHVRWTLQDLPVAAEEPYVQMASYLLAPEVDVKPDPAWWGWGEMEICRLVSLRTDRRPIAMDAF